MSHIHLPDGVLPIWLILAGWLATGALVALAVMRSSKLDLRKRVPLIGAIAALMVVGMSSEIVPIAYHVNLSVIAGILLGPWLSVIASLVVNTIIALVGHGGVTVIGLNTFVLSIEMIAGWAIFHALAGWLGRNRGALSSGIATVLALALATTVFIGIVALGGSPAASRESGALDPQSLRFENPFAGGLLANELLSGEEEDEAEEGAADDSTAEEDFSLGRFAAFIYTLGSIGWVLEALVTAAIVGFVARVRPRLVFDGAPAEGHRTPLGDEGLHR